MSMATDVARARSSNRRGAAVAAVVLLIAAVQMIAITSVGGGRHDADQAIRRVMAQRASYASDAAALIAIRQARGALSLPTAGTTICVGNAEATFVETPPALSTDDTVVEGRADNSSRRVSLSLAGVHP